MVNFDAPLVLESSLLPAPDMMEWKQGKIAQIELSTLQRAQHLACQTFTFIAGIALLPLSAAIGLGSRVLSLFSPSEVKLAKIDPIPTDPASVLPADFGFADSLFQSSGLGTFASATPLEGKSNWDKYLSPKNIEGKQDYPDYFIDILGNPKPFIDALKEMHVSAHRFSLEWAVIEPKPGQIDMEAVGLYRNFINALKKEGIEPYVTLHHFVLPEWFSDFDSLEKSDRFVSHALQMMELFPEVANWMTFNEPTVYAFSTRIRGAFPPGATGDFQGAAEVIRNILIAHCNIYKAAKEKWGDRIQVGLTHQWLKFVPFEGNPMERAFCYLISKVNHYCVYHFLKTGKFDFEIPAYANVHLQIPEEEFEANNRFLDFIGVQFYSYPRIKMGFNGGEDYPGYKTKNINLGWTGLTFGATCPKGGKTLHFGPSFYPESLEDCLTEAAALKKPIAITEIGCDAKVQKWGDREFRTDDETQKEFFVKIMPILHRFKDQMKAFFVWTLYRGQLEWDRGDETSLGVAKFKKDASRRITEVELLPAAKFLQGLFQTRGGLRRT